MGYRPYNDEARLRGLLDGPFGLYIFINSDVDQSVLSDPRVLDWADASGYEIAVDRGVWPTATGVERGLLDYPHHLVVDDPESSVLMVRDLWAAQSFFESLCLSDCPR